MFTHEPENYSCPFCRFVAGEENERSTKNDIVYEDADVIAKIAPKWWVNNPGAVLVIPKQHYENIYNIPEELFAKVYVVVQKLAIAIRSTYGCDGTSTRQHNEPAGNQDVWHLHVHVFPRYTDDNLYLNHDNKAYVDAAARAPYAEKLRAYLEGGVAS